MSSGAPGSSIPVARQNQIVRADQPQASVRERLVDHDLGTRRVQHAIEDQRKVHVVEAHGTELAAADAAERESIPFPLSHFHVTEALSGFTDDSDQRARLSSVMRRCEGLGVCRLRLWEWGPYYSESKSADRRRHEPSGLS